jgi:hypothetical protein
MKWRPTMPTYEVKVIGQVVKVFTIDSNKSIDEGNWDEDDEDTFNDDTAKDLAIDKLADEYEFDLMEVLECREIV